LNEHDPQLEQKIARAFRQWNNVIRDLLRNEMGLRLSIGDEAQAVPVRVEPGLPAPFQSVVEQIPPALWRFLLRLPALESAVSGLDAVIENYLNLDSGTPIIVPTPMPPAVVGARDFCRDLVDRLQRFEIRKKLGQIDEDVLGAYFFRVPQVHIYWMVIGLVAGLLGVNAESLTVVVAVHELAHAYSHLGRDIDGSRWQTESFAHADLAIVEGIAQFYTGVVCRKLEMRNPSAYRSYQSLLELQGGPYRVHEGWGKRVENGKERPVEQIGEVVRACLIECRTRGLRGYGQFCDALEDHRMRLG
jgi:hypothetical protein